MNKADLTAEERADTLEWAIQRLIDRLHNQAAEFNVLLGDSMKNAVPRGSLQSAVIPGHARRTDTAKSGF